MLATRVAARRAAKLSRRFATAIDSAGVKIAAVDHGQPTTAVTFLVNAGSRYETKPGLANFLKNYAFRSTSSRSALGTVREAELYGGVLSSSLSREHLAFTAEFLRGDETYFVDVLSSLITSSRFSPWDLKEAVIPVVEEETRTASSDPAIVALELAHALAFRSGLGSSVFAPAHPSVTLNEVKAYAQQVFSKGNIAVLGSGISQEALSKLVQKHLGGSSASGTGPTSSPSKYFGGETRQVLHSGPETVFIGYGVTGAPSAELAVLAAHLSTTPSVKWSQGLSPLVSAIPSGTSVQTVLLPYSDATLFGLLIQGESTAGVKEAAATAVKALKASAESGSVKPEEVKKAVAKAKFAAASATESREGFISTFGPKVLSGAEASLSGVLSAFDGVSESVFIKAASSLLKTTPTFVAVGDTSALPYRDEVGL